MVGAWSLSGDDAVAQLGGDERHSIRTVAHQLAGSELREVTRKRLWLYAPTPCIVASGEVTACGIGFFASPGIGTLLSADGHPEGHFASARHDASVSSLTLRRSTSGGERLYFAKRGNLVLFSTSVAPLLAIVGARLNRNVLPEVILTGLTMFGSETLHDGVDEVLPGYQRVLTDAIGPARLSNSSVVTPPRGDPKSLAVQFRERLTTAVAASAGPSRPVVVALSGGIDSSAIAAAAVDAFGADKVLAITYEFDDPSHSVETHYAKLVAKKLGIRSHYVFRLRTDEYLAAIPEMIHRSESLVHWPKAFMLLVAREVKRLGFDRYLTGFGIGSHMAYLEELGRSLRVLPKATVIGGWRSARFTSKRWPHHLRRFHPAFEPPHPRLYYLLVALLGERGYLSDVHRFFPAQLAPLLDSRRTEVEPITDEEASLPLGGWLQRRALARGVGCIDVTRSEKASRELGVYRISPAHFDSCIPFAHFPIEPRPRLYSAARNLRPGKYLLRLAFAGTLPDEVLNRRKSWADAVASDDWLRAGRKMMLSVLPDFPRGFASFGDELPNVISYWESKSILATGLALRLWMALFVERTDFTAAPSWDTLWRQMIEKRECA